MSWNNSLTARKTSNESFMHCSSNMQHENWYKPSVFVLMLNSDGDNLAYLKKRKIQDENTQFHCGFCPWKGEEISRPREAPTPHCQADDESGMLRVRRFYLIRNFQLGEMSGYLRKAEEWDYRFKRNAENLLATYKRTRHRYKFNRSLKKKLIPDVRKSKRKMDCKKAARAVDAER